EGTVFVGAKHPTTTLTTTVSAVVTRDTTASVVVKFPPVGRLDVQVNFARGAAAPFAPLQLQESARGSDFRNIGSTHAGGHTTLDGLSGGAFVVRATHPANSRIVATASGTLTTDGSVAGVTVALPPSGTVRGTVSDKNGPVAGISVTVRSANAAFGGFQSQTTDSAGSYAIAGVPDGPFVASVQEFARQLFGEASGRIDADGPDAVANISLINNAVSLPADRYDANGHLYRIEANGRISSATASVFGSNVVATDGAAQLEIVSGGSVLPFTGAAVGTMEQDGREIVIR